MNAYESQAIRYKYKVTWQEEYIVGMVNKFKELNTTRVFKTAELDRVMTQATTWKYLKSAIYRKLINEVPLKKDRRVHVLTLTPKGEKFIEELRRAK